MAIVYIPRYPRGLDPERMIVRYLEVVSKEDASCPHCGCTGKHIQYFITADGKRRGAMAGCLKKFYAAECANYLKEWEAKLKKFPGWKRAIENIAFQTADGDRIIAQVKAKLAAVDNGSDTPGGGM